MLTTEQKEEILRGFPNFKLYCENIAHNKVSNDDIFYTAIPHGKKGYIWFVELYKKPVCLFLQSGKHKEIIDITIVNCCFDRKLCYCTILYGTQFSYENSMFFSTEDIIYHKGSEVFNFKWGDKLKLLNKLFSNDIKQIEYNEKFIVLGLPFMHTNIDRLMEYLPELGYKINAIQTRYFSKIGTSTYQSLFNKETKQYEYKLSPKLECHKMAGPKLEPFAVVSPKLETIRKLDAPKSESPESVENKKQLLKAGTSYKQKKDLIFRIKPDLQNDIYHLYCLENDELVYYDIAFIPDYITSVMMNKLFRNIKENQNLDALEESDDEDEFEDERADRFVDLNKEYNMKCKYNYKFKKWYPICVVNMDTPVVKKDEI
jgi:hypothetical protein